MVHSLGAAALVIAVAYIIHVRRELARARQRGDMYRDIAARLDRQHAQSSPVA